MDEKFVSEMVALVAELEHQLGLLAKTVALQNQTIEASLASEILVIQLIVQQLGVDPDALIPELLSLAEQTSNSRLREQLELHVLALRKLSPPPPEGLGPRSPSGRPAWCQGVIDGGKPKGR